MTVARIGHQYWIRVGTQLKSFHPSPNRKTDRDLLELSSSRTHQSLASPSFGLAQLSLSLVTVILWQPNPCRLLYCRIMLALRDQHVQATVATRATVLVQRFMYFCLACLALRSKHAFKASEPVQFFIHVCDVLDS